MLRRAGVLQVSNGLVDFTVVGKDPGQPCLEARLDRAFQVLSSHLLG